MNVTVIRSARKTISLEITKDLAIIVRAPYTTSNSKIETILREKNDWITKTALKLQQKNAETLPFFSEQELKELEESARKTIVERVAQLAKEMGITYNKISFGFQKSRWGSCSSKGNLRFNCLLMCMPSEIRDYVIIHELCHRKYMNHSSSFWSEVQKFMPNFIDATQWLKINGSTLISRLP